VTRSSSGNTSNDVLLQLRREPFKNITDGTSKTILLGESTNIYELTTATRTHTRRSLWAYSWGNYVLSQVSPQPATLWGDLTRCLQYGGVVGSPKPCQSGWFSFHAGDGMNIQFCDGSGQWLSFDVDGNVFAHMASIAGDELDSDR
jgi:hypothetical protein